MPSEPKNSREQIEKAFFELLKEKHYQKITVTSIIKRAGVNRSTFYRWFENVEDLMECVAEDVKNAVAVEPPFPVKDTEGLERYAMVMLEKAEEYHELVHYLSGENGKMQNAYRICTAVRERLREQVRSAGITDPAVLRSVEMASPHLSMYFMLGNILPEEFLSLPEPEIFYDNNRSLLQNVARMLSKRKGGSEFFHYDLLCAYVKLDAASPEEYRSISVSELLDVAGIHRTEFYKYYKNIDDYFTSFEDACVFCALYWLSTFSGSMTWPDGEDMKKLVSNEAVKGSIVKFFTHARITQYYPKILNLVLRYINSVVPGGLDRDQVLRFSYYLSVFSYAICTYLIGASDYAELKKTFDSLQGVRDLYGL